MTLANPADRLWWELWDTETSNLIATYSTLRETVEAMVEIGAEIGNHADHLVLSLGGTMTEAATLSLANLRDITSTW